MNKLIDYFNSLEDRERNILIAGIAFAIGFIVINFMIIPVFDYKKRIQSGINSFEYQAGEIEKLGIEYREITGNNTGSHMTDINFALFSYINSLAGKTGIKSNIESIKPSKDEMDNYLVEKVEVVVSGIDMMSLVSFLYEIESSPNNIRIKGLSIKKSDKGGTINSTIQAEIVKKNA